MSVSFKLGKNCKNKTNSDCEKKRTSLNFVKVKKGDNNEETI